ncbi:hypothetical protein NN561_005215 [Cricetulus griseus]
MGFPRGSTRVSGSQDGAGWGGRPHRDARSWVQRAISALTLGNAAGLGINHAHAQSARDRRRSPLTQRLCRIPKALPAKVRPRRKPARPDGEVTLVCEAWVGRPGRHALSTEPRPAQRTPGSSPSILISQAIQRPWS